MVHTGYRTAELDGREFDAAQEYRLAIVRLLDYPPQHVFAVHVTPSTITVTTNGPGQPTVTTYTRKQDQ